MNRNISSDALLKSDDGNSRNNKDIQHGHFLKHSKITDSLLSKNGEISSKYEIDKQLVINGNVEYLDDGYIDTENYVSDDIKEQEIDKDYLNRKRYVTKIKFLRTAAAYMSFLPMGMATAILGATLLQLKHQVSTEQSTIVMLFTWRGLGCIGGNAIAGTLFNKIKPELLFFISAIALGLSVASVPLYNHFVPMAVAFVIIGVATGVLGAGLNAYMVEVWKYKAPPFIQGLHFAVSLGSTLGPLISSPFVKRNEEIENVTLYTHNHTKKQISTSHAIDPAIDNIDNDTVGGYEKSKSDETETLITELSNYQLDSHKTSTDSTVFQGPMVHVPDIISGIHSEISVPYFIIASVCSIGVLLFVIVLISDRNKNVLAESTSTDTKLQHYNHANISRLKSSIIISLLSMLCICYGGLESTFGGYITTFGILYLKLSNFTSALLATTFWGAFATGRGLGILLIHIMESKSIIIMDCCLAILSLSLFPFTCKFHVVLIFMLCGLLGLSFSTIYANILSYTQKQFLMSPKIASIFTISLYVGMMTFPTIVGKAITVLNPLSLIYILLGLAIFALLNFLFTYWFITLYVHNTK